MRWRPGTFEPAAAFAVACALHGCGKVGYEPLAEGRADAVAPGAVRLLVRTRAAARANSRSPAHSGARAEVSSMSRDTREKRDKHALNEHGMVLCNPRDREAAHRAEMEGIATDDRDAVTCPKCLALLYKLDKDRRTEQ